MTEGLVYEGRTFNGLRGQTFYWCIVFTWRFERKDVPTFDLIASMLSDDAYATTLMTAAGRDAEVDDEQVHGPFLLSSINPDAFRIAAVTELTQAAGQFASESGAVRGSVEDLRLREFVDAEHVARTELRKLDDTDLVRHSMSWILDPFIEFLQVDRTNRQLHAIILASD